MIENFLLNPFFALILVTFVSSMLGVFVLWNKLSYFGDAMSHSSLLGLILGTFFEVDQIFSLLVFAIIFAIIFSLLDRGRYLAKDSLVMIISYFCVGVSAILNDVWLKNFSFSSYIFGDVLTVSNADLLVLGILSIVVILYSLIAFRKILLINVNYDLAKIEGIKIQFWKWSFVFLLSISIALSVRIVGVLLITALLVLPAAIARIFSNSAKIMMIASAILGLVVSMTSFKVAANYDVAVGPVVVVSFVAVFVVTLLFQNLLKTFKKSHS